MSLKNYFNSLIKQVEASDAVQNDGKDENGFYKPTKAILLRHLQLLHDLHDKPNAKEMVKASWNAVIEVLPPEWLVLKPEEKAELKKIIS